MSKEKSLSSVFQEFHENPEASFQESETTKRIESYLKAWNIRVLTTGLKTGLVAEIGDPQGDTVICLRADIDALPITEETELSYKSKNGFMHACGHDFHTTALLGAAYLLKQEEETLKGKVKLLFQPAEESSHGAEDVIASGVLADVDAIFGLHVSPSHQTGTIGFRSHAVTASVDRFEIEIEGVGCHAARPNQGIDPTVVAAHIVTALQSIVSRNVNPFDPVVVSVTHLKAGNTWNVIPSTAFMEGTVRTLQKETRAFVPEKIKELSENIAAGFGAKADFRWYPGPPPTNNTPFWVEEAGSLAKELGIPQFESDASMGGEDFAFYQETIPGVFFQVGVGSPYPLHHPKFQADTTALEPASAYLSALAKRALHIEAERKTDA